MEKTTKVKKPKVPYIDRALNGIFLWERNPKGEIGIEVEVEGGPWPEGVATNWLTHVDNSLRNGGIEYIIRQPVARDRVRAALDVLVDHLAKSTKVFSYRTSIHVHVNVQDLTLRQWVNYIVLFCILEELLVNVVGPERAGNKFCLRFKDADESLRAVRQGVTASAINDYLAGDLKYASCNLRATASHGTLEFRAMRGNLDAGFITAWAEVLLALKDAARATKSPTVFIEEMSMLGPREFARKYLPRNNPITQGVLDQDDIINNSMYEGARLAQDVAYCMEWGEPVLDVGPSLKDAPVEMEPDPDVFAPAAAAAAADRLWRQVEAPVAAPGGLAGWGAPQPAMPDINWDRFIRGVGVADVAVDVPPRPLRAPPRRRFNRVNNID